MSNFISHPKYTCALGAQQTVLAITRAVPIVHSGPGCAFKVHGLLGQGQSYVGGGSIPCTNAGSKEVVFGGVNKLDELIRSSFKVLDGDLFVVLTGCTSDIIGDDIASVAERYQEEGKPVVYAETGGFKSNNYSSHSTVVNAIIDQYVDKYRVGEGVEKGLVNVFSSIPDQDPYWEGNLEELKRILEGIGLKVNILFGSRSGGLDEWKTIPNAQLNIVADAWTGVKIAKHLERKYGTPYLHFPYFPVGGEQTSDFLRRVADAVGADKKLTEQFIKKEEERFYIYLERMADFILEFKYNIPRRFYSVLDSSYAVGMSKFLVNELGILPSGVFISDNTPEKFQKLVTEELNNISEYRSVTPVFETDGEKILLEIDKDDHKNRFIILGSAWESHYAKEHDADLLLLNIPLTYRLVLNCTYIGYNGGLRVIEEIYNGVLSTYRT
ncbi:nitrogenase molybdenum-iron protein beta chain [Ruminococcus sp. YE71]|uniref:nitrogenase component 1 n=1 Tax=unclassified Ruminococcus TaxID=2608920 RepID=UPI000890D176|nr:MULTISPECIES: nitrogenase component 1 [unclassified Ruminococcus]SDA21772.1 nitrogenase molybdenum-iron protein beta chain [Ruminococcus sp. YE78]SFW36854.1 nitrogenase molybdenum-iron protein beta chain [Ruminococcus sp. YE71]